MLSNAKQNDVRGIASVLATVATYYAVRITLRLPSFSEMFTSMESRDDSVSLSSLILNNPYLYLTAVILVAATTFLAIWKKFKGSHRVYPLGILLLFIMADRALAAALDPLVKMVTTMGQ